MSNAAKAFLLLLFLEDRCEAEEVELFPAIDEDDAEDVRFLLEDLRERRLFLLLHVLLLLHFFLRDTLPVRLLLLLLVTLVFLVSRVEVLWARLYCLCRPIRLRICGESSE